MRHTILDKKYFNFFELPTNQALHTLNLHEIDVLINLGNNKQTKAMALSKLVPAKCKISQFQNPIFDINIDGDKSNNTSQFLEQVIVYLHMIKTHK